jgi:hypothetical protein
MESGPRSGAAERRESAANIVIITEMDGRPWGGRLLRPCSQARAAGSANIANIAEMGVSEADAHCVGVAEIANIAETRPGATEAAELAGISHEGASAADGSA